MGYRRVIAAIAAIGVVATAVVGCTSNTTDGADDSTLVMAMVSPTAGQAFNFSPGFSDWDSLLARPVYEFMITNKQNEDGSLGYAPGVATDWVFSDDLTTLTLTLRPDTTFSDGEPVNAEAVVANVDYWLENEIAINWGRFAAGAVATDEYTVEIQLNEAAQSQGAPQIEFGLINAMIMSPKALEDPEKLANSPVGSGPYVLDEAATTPGTEYTFVRAEDYWNADIYAYDTIVLKIYPDGVAAVNALKSGQVDFAPVDSSTAGDVEASGFPVIKTPGGVRGLMLGDKGGAIAPPLADVRVRQAMNMAFDRQAIVDNLDKGYNEPTSQPWLPGYPQYDPALEEAYPYDPEKAKELLAEAGYPDGFELTLPTYADQPVLTQYDPIVKQSLADVGITVTYETVDWFPNVTEPNFAVTNNYIGLAVQSYYLEYHGLFNPWDYQDPKMIDLLQQYNFGPVEERNAVAAEIGQYTSETAWMLIFSSANSLYAASPKVEILQNLPLYSAPDFQYLAPAK